MTRSINLTPTWAGITPALIEMIRQGREPSATIAHEELMRMARLADQFVAFSATAEPESENGPRLEIKVKR